jgi:hypothetical protein
MKTFKVMEKYISYGWTYVKAETKEDAQAMFCGNTDDFREEESTHAQTYWDTLQEVIEKNKK